MATDGNSGMGKLIGFIFISVLVGVTLFLTLVLLMMIIGAIWVVMYGILLNR
jgi:hypothetical protein